MPCRGPDVEDCVANYSREMDAATRVACELMKVLRLKRPNWELGLTPTTKRWIARHDALDKKREQEESAARKLKQLKRSAIAKLTPEERRALDI